MIKKTEHVTIGSRGSELALWQARWVEQELRKRFRKLEVSIVVIKTTGDKILDSPLSKIGDKGLFTREIEQALLSGEIDLAVHSLKDLPTELPDGLTVGAITRREDVREAFIPHPGNPEKRLLDQPDGAKIATGSLRRKCQLLNMRPDFDIIDLRGNLNTRLKKLEESDWAGMILARAGVVRLGWEQRIGETIDAQQLLPAVGQGALGVEIRIGDKRIGHIVRELHHLPTAQAALAERALLRELEGGCQVPIGTYARIEKDHENTSRLLLDALVGSLDGRTIVRGKVHGNPSDAELLGTSLADSLLKSGADRILRSIRLHTPSKPHAALEV
jgi:hydroxymethylbilane synthase